MSPTFLRACLDCGRLSPDRRCPDHGSSRRPHDDPEYRVNRLIVLANAETCALCGKPPTDSDPLEADHRLSSTIHDLTAMRPAHASCNRARGAPTVGRIQGVGGRLPIAATPPGVPDNPPRAGDFVAPTRMGKRNPHG